LVGVAVDCDVVEFRFDIAEEQMRPTGASALLETHTYFGSAKSVLG
jgi:hypothetical protein